MSFASDLEKFTEKAMKRATRFKQQVGMELFTSVIMDTPVDTGRARGNWQISLNQPLEEETEQSAAQAIGKVNRAGNHGTLEDAVYLTNNLPYIGMLEYGKSKQAPAGMMRKNVARIDRILTEQLRDVRR